MADFGFVRGKEFRDSLEADYLELGKAIQSTSWKMAQVLAGSIIEAMLIDYLVNSSYQARTGIDPLRLDLSKAITACEQEGILSSDTGQLCTVIKSYRNLIHPGRSVRLGEKADEHKASVAKALVEIVVDAIRARTPRSEHTAEQILAKVEVDSSSLPILEHLLREAGEAETERFLLDVLPDRYFEVCDHCTYEELSVLEKSFRTAYDFGSTAAKRNVAAKMTNVIKRGTIHEVNVYERVFFRGSDLMHFTPEQTHIVKEHLLSTLENEHPPKLIRSMKGLEEYLSDSELSRYFDALLLTLFTADKPVKATAHWTLNSILRTSLPHIVQKAEERILEMAKTYNLDAKGDVAEILKELRASEAVPF